MRTFSLPSKAELKPLWLADARASVHFEDLQMVQRPEARPDNLATQSTLLLITGRDIVAIDLQFGVAVA